MIRRIAVLILGACCAPAIAAAAVDEYDTIIEALERETAVEQKKAALEEARGRTAELAQKHSYAPETFARPVLVAIYGNPRWMRAVFARSATARFHAGVGDLVGDGETVREIRTGHVVIADRKGRTRTVFLGDAKGPTARDVERPGVATPPTASDKTP